MRALVLVFWDLCRLRRGPETVPAQPAFTTLLLVADILFALVFTAALAPSVSLLARTTSLVAMLAATATVTYGILAVRDQAARFPATFTAMLGVDLLLTCLLVPLYFLTQPFPPIVWTITQTVVWVWSLLVYGYILHRAMQTVLGIGIAIAFLTQIFALALAAAVTAPTPG